MMKKQSFWPYLLVAGGIVIGTALGLGSHNLATDSAAAKKDIPADAVTAAGTGQGFAGPITVEVTADQEKIYSVKILEHTETEGIGTKAIEALPKAIYEANSVAVDGVSGATLASDAIKAAVADALTKAGLDARNFGAETAMASGEAGKTESTAAADIPAGAKTLSSSVMGNSGDVEVEVVADEKTIYTVTVTKHQETPGIGTKAVEQIPAEIVNAQSLSVDAVSGATITSDAIVLAVKQALEEGGLDVAQYEGKKSGSVEKEADQELETEVLVVGAGGAGMTAAIEAADVGRKVILLESQSMVGGNSVRATGGMNAADTEWQDGNEFAESAGVEKALGTAAEKYADNAEITRLAGLVAEQWAAYQAAPEGYFDSAELMQLDTMIGGKGLNDPALVEKLVRDTPAAVSWLDSIGAELHNVGSFGGASVKRIHRPVNAEGKTTAVGAYMVPILEGNLAKRENITLLLSVTADQLLKDEKGAVVGVHATGKSGNSITVRAKSVVLATGGFGANLEMVVKYKPELKGFMTTNAAGIQGQGILMGEEAGAALVDMDQIQIHPTVEANTAHLITEGLRGDGAILVNAEGKRFVDEVGTRDVVSAAEIAQTGSYSWLVLDQKMADASAVIQGYIKSGYALKGESAKALAGEIGVPGEALAETLESWNRSVAEKKDAEFGRTSFAAPLDTAPYYAIKVTAGVHHTMGGLRINPETEVLNAEGTAIAGLYAAGEITGGVHGANRLGGNAVADFTVFGRIAGQQAAAYAAPAAEAAAESGAAAAGSGTQSNAWKYLNRYRAA